MKFWELDSIFREPALAEALSGLLRDPQWRTYDNWRNDLAAIVARQDRAILDAEVPYPLAVEAMKLLPWRFQIREGLLTNLVSDPKERTYTALEIYQRFGGSIIEEVREFGSSDVREWAGGQRTVPRGQALADDERKLAEERTFKSRFRSFLDDWGELVGKILVIVNCLGLIVLARWIWGDAIRLGLMFVGLAGGVAAILEMQLLDRLAGRHVPVLTRRTLRDPFVWICAVLLLGIAVFAWWDAKNQATRDRAADESQAENARRAQLFNDPKVKQGLEIMRQMQDRKAATRGAASGPASQP